MPTCAVQGCLSYSRKTKGTNIKYYSFPKKEELSKRWVYACHRLDKFNIQQGKIIRCILLFSARYWKLFFTARICSKHFAKDCFSTSLKHEMLKYSPKNHRDLKIDAIPTECLPITSKISNSNGKAQHERQQRNHVRNEKRSRESIIKSLIIDSALNSSELPNENVTAPDIEHARTTNTEKSQPDM